MADSTGSGDRLRRRKEGMETVSFSNGMRLDLLLDGDRFRGIGQVWFQGMLLRSAVIPWTVYAESEEGLRFDDFRLHTIERGAGGSVTLRLVADARWLPRVQAADMMGDARLLTRRQHRASADLAWRFRPITERIWENDWAGLAMQVEYRCPGHPIHWLLEDATWEIGGEAAGATLIQQDLSAIDPEQTVQGDSAFSTVEKFFNESGGVSLPMDMLPRGAGACICDFQVKDDTALCLFSEKPGLTRSRIEKFADENVIHFTDRPFFALTEQAVAPERKLLVHRQARTLLRHEWRNLWLDCFTDVRRRVLAHYAFAWEPPRPTVWAHLWDDELKRRGPAWTTALQAALPAYRRLGFSDVFTHGVWESVTSDPRRTAAEGNICSPYAFRYAEAFGGTTGMKALSDAAHAQGLRLFQWFGFQLSTHAPVWQEHPDWVLREANGDPWDGNYKVLQCGRMRSGFGAELVRQAKAVRDATGLDGIFWDSYQNLGLTCVDWQSPDKAPQAEEIWRAQAELQRHGFSQRCESVAIFGVSTVSLYGLDEKTFRRRLWSDTLRQDDAFALLDTSPGFMCTGNPFTPERISPQLYFWLAGHRALPNMSAYPWAHAEADGLPGGAHAEQYGCVNRWYLAALPHMHRLRVTPGGAYALWLDREDRPAVIWAFRDGEAACAVGAHCLSGPEPDVRAGRLAFKAGQVYLLGSAAGM